MRKQLCPTYSVLGWGGAGAGKETRWVGHPDASGFHSSADLFGQLSLRSVNRYSPEPDSLLYAGERGSSRPICALESFTAQGRQKSTVSSVRGLRTRSHVWTGAMLVQMGSLERVLGRTGSKALIRP